MPTEKSEESWGFWPQSYYDALLELYGCKKVKRYDPDAWLFGPLNQEYE